MKPGEVYEAPSGHRWKVTEIHTDYVAAKSVDAPAIDATISLGEIGGWVLVPDRRTKDAPASGLVEAGGES